MNQLSRGEQWHFIGRKIFLVIGASIFLLIAFCIVYLTYDKAWGVLAVMQLIADRPFPLPSADEPWGLAICFAIAAFLSLWLFPKLKRFMFKD